jgi:acetylornithine deacetylase/succinyl-diaminopimelate desuccinylase-like protein
VVPDRVSFRLDRRIIPEENPVEVEAGLRALIADAAVAYPGIRVEIKQILLATPLVPQSGWETLSAAIGRAARSVLELDVPTNGVPLYTDARHYASRGIPCVLYGAGPRTLLEANAHNADENLRLSDLRAATQIVALAAAEICSSKV